MITKRLNIFVFADRLFRVNFMYIIVKEIYNSVNFLFGMFRNNTVHCVELTRQMSPHALDTCRN